MKRLLFCLSLLIPVSLSAQYILQGGLGVATSSPLGAIGEIEAGYQFPKKEKNIQYQATGGLITNPTIGKSVVNIKAGVNVHDEWTFKAGIGMVDGLYTILILGAERYIKKWEKESYKVYYGADLIDGAFHAKLGLRFLHKTR